MTAADAMSNWDRFVFTFFNADIAMKYGWEILQGAGVTILAGLAVVITGIGAGFGLAALRAIGWKPVNFLIIVFVDIFRSLPPLAIILVLFFGFPSIGIVLPSLIVLWMSLGAVLAAFAEEIFWAGITSVPKGQWLAARSTGLTFAQTLRYVILPQAVRLGIPPLTNRAISITKNLALGSAIGVNEILGRANSALSMSANATPLTMGALLYVLVFIPLVIASRTLERNYRWGEH
ncbi:amino acid ABC transporter permease [Tardiphaga sp. 866_E4_N2_1]|uniref:amino acid ABC transporter permease n=1 Tax=unclassified Tardiphaga TaxID=2631404 RepID=UPI003F252DC7